MLTAKALGQQILAVLLTITFPIWFLPVLACLLIYGAVSGLFFAIYHSITGTSHPWEPKQSSNGFE
jgi:hypothetical protein